ncbi:hypothetical protein [Micromonospora coerulea]|uniref:hypothetical protein n=1 Tax=Micromonospora coerulea TaxID=47856 RepID=UPI00190474AD|nr:hypothetical protein [Micromonospora veneta]
MSDILAELMAEAGSYDNTADIEAAAELARNTPPAEWKPDIHSDAYREARRWVYGY